jgi:cell division protein FtsI (penicillin-binding protein 3)
VVLDPRTGAVLAMASLPTFDPNRYREAGEANRRNRAIQDAYEPGSTFKLITAASVLEANLADPADVFDCGRGGVTVYGTRINDHRSFDRLTFREVIAKSSNVGAIRLGLLAGPERLHKAVEHFGFGRLTGIDLPGENAGLARPLKSWQKRSVAYVSFGQEISVTPLQLTLAFAAIANGGFLHRPYVVESGREPQVIGRPIGDGTARSLERMLEAVVEEGTATQAAVPGYTVAGKTGTAQKAVPGLGYVAGRYVASFVGFVPARDPRLVALIVVDEPRGPLYHGGDVAAGIFASTMRQALLYLAVPPDRREGAPWEALDRIASGGSSPATTSLR